MNDLILSQNETSQKFVAILNKKIELGKLFNALGHCTAGLVAFAQNIDKFSFLKYNTSEGNITSLISHYGFIILKADNSNQVRKARLKAQELGILNNFFTESMTIGTSKEQLSATSLISDENQNYFCVTMFGDSDIISSFTKNFSLYK